MKWWSRAGRVAWIPLLYATAAWAVERFPPPEFESGHIQPTTTTPPPRAVWLEYLDVGVLLAALALATWLVYRTRSRRGVLLLSVFSVAYFGFYRKGCVCAIGSIQNVALAAADKEYVLPLTVAAFFALPLIFALIFGRTFCSSVCPHGALQDLVVVRPVAVPRWLDEALGLLAYAYLGAGVLFAAAGAGFVLCRYDPFIAFFRLTGDADLLALGAALLVIGMFVGRPYCRYLCPYGVLLGLASRLSWRRVTIYPDECVRCHLCRDSCPYGALRTAPAETGGFEKPLERSRLVTFLVLTPVLVGYFAWLGGRLGPALSRSHPTVQLAEAVRADQRRPAEKPPDEVRNFLDSGKKRATLYASAKDLVARFSRAGWWWGAWVGLVVGMKLIAGTVWRTRTEYEADRGACVACARCFPYCPEMQVRLAALAEQQSGGETQK